MESHYSGHMNALSTPIQLIHSETLTQNKHSVILIQTETD